MFSVVFYELCNLSLSLEGFGKTQWMFNAHNNCDQRTFFLISKQFFNVTFFFSESKPCCFSRLFPPIKSTTNLMTNLRQRINHEKKLMKETLLKKEAKFSPLFSLTIFLYFYGNLMEKNNWECYSATCLFCSSSHLLGAPEVTANLYCNFAYLYWKGCVICSIYLPLR